MSEAINICQNCRHHRLKKLIIPFAKIDVWTPEILKAKVKWEQEQAELALIEQQRYESGAEFDYEPNNYLWCVCWTEKGNRCTIDPVTGSKSTIFILCANANKDGKCQFFESLPNKE